MKIDRIPDDAVLIKGTTNDYVDPRGNVYSYDYRYYHKGVPYKKECQCVHGYYYVPINYNGRRITKRVHRIVAEAFIPNPNDYPIVMHLDNNKRNNDVSNLAWGTIKQNTRAAFDDGLMVNAKGEEDSQSIPCDMYDSATNKLIGRFGSCREAERETGISLAVIRWQMNKNSPVKKPVYFTNKDAGSRDHTIIVRYDMLTDNKISQHANIGVAAKETGISDSSISAQVNLLYKPKWTKDGTYFKRMYLKGEEIIEIDKRVE